MADVDKILSDLLSNERLENRSVFTSRTYSDQPIIQTGKQMRERIERNRKAGESFSRSKDAQAQERPGSMAATPLTSARTLKQSALPPTQKVAATQDLSSQAIPERYYQLRELTAGQTQPESHSWHGALAYGTRAASRLFFEQARLMEDFEDSYVFSGDYSQYFPTYSTMTLSQLRGYFSWRTRVRAGEVGEAPLSFAFLYVYELLCGIGTTPGEQGYRDLRAFRDAFSLTESAQGSAFNSYLRRWMRDYVIYHGLDLSLLPQAASVVQTQQAVLLRAEEETLATLGLQRRGEALAKDDGRPAVSDEELLDALDACATYRIKGVRLYKDYPEELQAVSRETFRALVTHCARRRKTDFTEGLFGAASSNPYVMFSSAVFYEEEPHPDSVVSIGDIEIFTCTKGSWRQQCLFRDAKASRELGTIMHAVDQLLRERLDYPYPLKERAVPAYVKKIINKAIDAVLAERAEAERRRINIDLSQLSHIRAAAALTQEALLTDEEREDTAPAAEKNDFVEGARSGEVEPHEAAAPVAAPVEPAASPSGAPALTAAETTVMTALLHGEPVPPAPDGQMLSLVVDSINDKLFDLVGDAVIEFDQDTPILIEDYEQDVREMLEL